MRRHAPTPGMLSLLVACGPPAVEGEVRTVDGAPAAGATVALEGRPDCSAEVDAAGRFALPCATGGGTLVVEHAGHLPLRAPGPSPSADDEAAPLVLVPLPAERGLYWVQGEGLAPLARAWVARRVEGEDGPRRTRAWCLPPEAPPGTEVPRGVQGVLDRGTAGWRPLHLDAEGCAYRDRRNDQGQWEVTWKDKPSSQERSLGPDARLVLLDLAPGEYFLADWHEGFFTPSPGTPGAYGGYRLVVR